MAAPVDSARVQTNIATAATSHNINVGSPAAGDLLVVFVRFGGAPGTVAFTGYTLLGTADTSDASDDDTRVYYRWADGTEGATDILTNTSTQKLSAICWRITGAENPATKVPTRSSAVIGTTTANTANGGSVAPTGAPIDTLYLAMCGGDGEVGAYTGLPTNYSNLIAGNSGTGGQPATNVLIGGASRQVLNSTSDDPGAFTHGAHTTGWTGFTVAIPAAPPPATPKSGTDSGVGTDVGSIPPISITPGAYTTEIQADSPRAWYRMQELAGFIQDSSGNANHATAETGSAKTRAQASAVNEAGQVGIKFNQWGCMRIPHHSTLDMAGTFTLEAWVKLAAINDGVIHTIITKGQGGFHFYINNSHDGVGSGRLEFTSTYTTLIAASDNKYYIQDFDWHHIAVVKTPTTVKLYCDGVEVTTYASGSVTVADTTYPLEIGAWGDNGYPGNFTLDEVAVYNTALSQARLQAHFDANFANPQRLPDDQAKSADVVNLDHIFRADFEGGTDGATPTTSDVASPTVDGQKWDVVNKPGASVLEYDNTRAAAGTKSLKLSSPDGTSIPYVEWKIQKGPERVPTRHYHRCYIWLTGYPVGTYIALPDMSSYSYWSIGPNGKLGFNAQGNLCDIFAGGQCSPALPLNQWIRIETWFEQAIYLVTDRGQAGARIFYTDPYGTSHDVEINTGGGWVLGDQQLYSRWGVYPAIAGSCPEFWLDEIVSGALTWVGPVVPPGIPKDGTDAGSGLDELISISRAVPDTGSDTEISNKACEGTDSGAGTDAGMPKYLGSDTGAGSENATLTAAIPATDTGTSSETAAVPTVSDSKADLGAGSDITSLSRQASDSGAGTDSGSQAASSPTLGQWFLNESPAIHGTTITDASGSGNHGTLSTGEGSTDKAVTGKIGGGITFDGANDRINVNNTVFNSMAGDFTISAWVRNTDQTHRCAIVCKDDAGTNGRVLFVILNSDIAGTVWAGKIVTAIFSNDTTYFSLETNSNIVSANLWHHIVYRRESTMHSIWVDGVSVFITPTGGGGTAGLTTQAGVSAFQIGSRTYAGNEDFFEGDIDHVAVYSRALSDSEIADAYAEGGTPKAGSDTGTDSETSVISSTNTQADSGTSSEITTLAAARTQSDTGAGTEVSILATVIPIQSDTGAATETSALVAKFTQSDTGTDTETVILSTQYSQVDTGAGVDAAILTVAYALSDTGAATDNGTTNTPISVSDTGTSSETTAIRIATADTGIGSEVSVISLIASDTGTAVETPSVQLTASDTGTDAEIISALARAVADVGSDTEDTILSAGNAKQGTDNGTGSEASALTAVFTQSDTGTDSEAIAIQIVVSDIASGSDISGLARVVVDSGASSDASILAAGNTKSGTDTGLGLESAEVFNAVIAGSDTGTGSDASAIKKVYLGADTGTGTETITTSRMVSDFGGATEEGSQTSVNSLLVSQTGTGSDTANVAIRLFLSDIDSGISTEIATLNISFAEPEYHHSVLIQATGYTSETISTVRRKPQMVTANGGRSKMSKAQ